MSADIGTNSTWTFKVPYQLTGVGAASKPGRAVHRRDSHVINAPGATV